MAPVMTAFVKCFWMNGYMTTIGMMVHTTAAILSEAAGALSMPEEIAVALLGSAGIEWDISSCTPDELERLREGVACCRRLRHLLHTGVLSHPDTGDDGATATAVIAEDGGHVIVRLARHATGDRALAPTLRVPGLDPASRYRVAPVPELPVPRGLDDVRPPWLEHGELRLSGTVLAEVGLQMPLLAPGEALVLELTRLPSAL